MPRLPDLSGYTFDQLNALISAANKRVDAIRSKRVKELQAELDKLGVSDRAPTSRRGPRSSRDGSGASALRPINAGKSVPAQFRGPRGEEYSGRGAIPRWARELGVSDRAGLEQYRIK